MDSRQPGSSIHGIFQARILEWVAISYFRGSSWPRDRTLISCALCIGRWILYHWASQVLLVVKNLSANARVGKRHGFDPWVGKIPWRRAWKPTPVFLSGASHGQRNQAGYSPWGCRVDTTEHSIGVEIRLRSRIWAYSPGLSLLNFAWSN